MSLRTGLKSLGTTRGKSEADFVAALGRPSAVKTLGTGRRLVQWRRGRFRTQMIAVLFDRSDEFVEIVARYPSTRASRREEAAAAKATPSVQETLTVIDLRDAPEVPAQSKVRRGVWSRSPFSSR
ncbi:MAG: hypothetical protein QOH64_2064 [Acidimicrobiaceae bacterium]|jgi:hypothetical protein